MKLNWYKFELDYHNFRILNAISWKIERKNVENAQKKTEENQNISLQQKTNTNGISNGENKKQQQQKYQAYIENLQKGKCQFILNQ